MINYDALLTRLAKSHLRKLVDGLEDKIVKGLCTQRYGDLPGWLDALESLPHITPSVVELKEGVSVGESKELNSVQLVTIQKSFEKLIPWRKGPFNVFDIFIDTEWRSDKKWDRVLPHLAPLANRSVLDIGCGNGYHCWRMFGEGAKQVIGIDPSPRFVVQFYMLKHFIDAHYAQQYDKARWTCPVDVLPLAAESLPDNINAFDTTFSMGVLYHRRSPMDHLRELKATLRPGGELVLETLVIQGKLGEILVPEGRYAKMNNVWFIPSVATLESWMKKCGFQNIRCVDINQTNFDEQRVTTWMQYQSLHDFLDPLDPNLTIEGHPAPRRAIIVANAPK